MNEENSSALVRNPSGAVEKGAPGAKRLISSMVADTLALVKRPSTRIVVVYEEAYVLELISTVIRHYFRHAALLTFGDSEKAWQALLLSDPDLLITGHPMSRLDGEELLRRLLDRKATYPIIMATGWQSSDLIMRVEGYANRGLKASILNIPFEIESLVKALEAALKISRDAARPDETISSRTTIDAA